LRGGSAAGTRTVGSGSIGAALNGGSSRPVESWSVKVGSEPLTVQLAERHSVGMPGSSSGVIVRPSLSRISVTDWSTIASPPPALPATPPVEMMFVTGGPVGVQPRCPVVVPAVRIAMSTHQPTRPGRRSGMSWSAMSASGAGRGVAPGCARGERGRPRFGVAVGSGGSAVGVSAGVGVGLGEAGSSSPASRSAAAATPTPSSVIRTAAMAIVRPLERCRRPPAARKKRSPSSSNGSRALRSSASRATRSDRPIEAGAAGWYSSSPSTRR
jgi:hypothetical protein